MGLQNGVRCRQVVVNSGLIVLWFLILLTCDKSYQRTSPDHPVEVADSSSGRWCLRPRWRSANPARATSSGTPSPWERYSIEPFEISSSEKKNQSIHLKNCFITISFFDEKKFMSFLLKKINKSSLDVCSCGFDFCIRMF